MDYRDRILQLAQDGLLDPIYVIECFVRWNTQSDIKGMCEAEDIDIFDEYDFGPVGDRLSGIR